MSVVVVLIGTPVVGHTPSSEKNNVLQVLCIYIQRQLFGYQYHNFKFWQSTLDPKNLLGIVVLKANNKFTSLPDKIKIHSPTTWFLEILKMDDMDFFSKRQQFCGGKTWRHNTNSQMKLIRFVRI